MIIVFRLEDMARKSLAQKFESMLDFALNTFTIEVNNGIVMINSQEASISYNPNNFTKEQMIKDFVTTSFFKAFVKRNFYTVYLVNEQLI